MTIKELKQHCKDQLKRNFHKEEHELILNLIDKQEKSNELQEEMIKALVEIVINQWVCIPEDNYLALKFKSGLNSYIKIIEKYYDKPWEEIIKE
jgi:hypothetical protein